MPPRKASPRMTAPIELEGPVLLASTHKDVKNLAIKPSFYPLGLVETGDNQSEARSETPNITDNIDNTEQASTDRSTKHESSMITISDTDFANTGTSLQTNADGDTFRTESYEITDLFPEVSSDEFNKNVDTRDPSNIEVKSGR